jgi:hypothetical protein
MSDVQPKTLEEPWDPEALPIPESEVQDDGEDVDESEDD